MPAVRSDRCGFFFVGLALAFAWSMGAHYTGACMGMPYAMDALSRRAALGLMAVFVFLGGALFSHATLERIGTGIIGADLRKADAAMALLRRGGGGVFELGGPHVWRFREILVYILAQTQRRRPLVALPMGLLRWQAAIAERLPGKLLTQDQLLLLQRDNVVSEGMPGLAELGITPSAVEQIVPEYLRRYRPGGRRQVALA
jgi:hypothetical protein